MKNEIKEEAPQEQKLISDAVPMTVLPETEAADVPIAEPSAPVV